MTAWTLLAVCLAFLAFNFPPRTSIFMGDSGSTVLGFTIAFLGLDSCRVHSSTASSLAFPLVVAAFPLLDAGLAILRRLLSNKSPFHGDRAHFYDLLLARGWSARTTALSCYAINSLFVTLALLDQRSARFAPIGWLSLIASAGFCALGIRLGSLRASEPPAASHRIEA
jgi:UDP-N-acetylmuramyl pentapeptide phosphotransferase/UDP-N-acetylglucosamine-1-phosphate transferase